MNNEFIIVANHERLKCFRKGIADFENREPVLVLLHEEEISSKAKRRKTETDAEGVTLPVVETPPAKLEISKRTVNAVATRINRFFQPFQRPTWSLAAPEKMLPLLKEKLEADVREGLRVELARDLIPLPDSELLGYFEDNLEPAN